MLLGLHHESPILHVETCEHMHCLNDRDSHDRLMAVPTVAPLTGWLEQLVDRPSGETQQPKKTSQDKGAKVSCFCLDHGHS